MGMWDLKNDVWEMCRIYSFQEGEAFTKLLAGCVLGSDYNFPHMWNDFY